tara:strand:+ start:536 stop:838 length:303 start_codon:yes stop_codon:yes gene_type:complete
MEYKGVLRISLNDKEFGFIDMRSMEQYRELKEGKRNSYYQEPHKQMFTNHKGQPLTLEKAVLSDENPYIDFDPKEEGFKINYIDDVKSEGFIDCLIKGEL